MTVPDPAAYESLERRLDSVLGPDDAATLSAVLATLATRDDLGLLRQDVNTVKHDLDTVKQDVAALREDIGLVQLDLRDFKKDVAHEFELVRTALPEQFHKEQTRLIKWIVPTIFAGMTAFGAAAGFMVAAVS